MDILWIGEDEVKEALRVGEVIGAVEEAFRQHGLKQVQMPPKPYLNFPKYNGDLRVMPAYIESLDLAGVKIVNSHPDNPGHGLPTVMAVVILNDPKTGAPLAIMEGTHLTDMRTGAGGAVGVKYLARKDSSVVGLIGAGRQAKTQLLAINEVVGIEKVKVNSKSEKHAQRFKKETENIFDFEIKIEPPERVCSCDILVTTTPVRSPIIKSEWILEGTHINAIGADAEGKQELEGEILKRAKIVVDDIPQAVHSGEINVPLSKGVITKENIYCELGEVVAGKKAGRVSSDEITIFDSTGLAIQDVATANLVYQKAIKKK